MPIHIRNIERCAGCDGEMRCQIRYPLRGTTILRPNPAGGDFHFLTGVFGDAVDFADRSASLTRARNSLISSISRKAIDACGCPWRWKTCLMNGSL